MQIVVILAAMIAVGTVLYGVRALKNKKMGNIKSHMLTSLGLFSAMVLCFVIVGANDVVLAAEVAEATTGGLTLGDGLKFLAAALSTGLATIGTGVAVGSTGSSAIGAVSEDSTILGKTLIFVGMAEGIAIYGMIISILILFV
ncbi:MAG: ATPase [Cellulosilyticum sp.]|nr:ATPase [Cellulosilyticum sp.]